MGATKKDRRINAVLSVLFTILCIAWLYPVFMILMNSLKTERAITTSHAFDLPNAETFVGLTEAVDAARIASCGANRQTVRYIVVQSADAVAAVQPLVHWAAYLPPEQGQPKPNELPTAFIRFCRTITCPARPMWTSAWHWAA